MKLLINGASELPEVPGILAASQLVDVVALAPDVDTLAAELPDTDIILGWNFRGRELESQWQHARELRWIHWCGAGVDAMLFPELAASDVTITNSRGLFDQAMAEYVLGYMLSEVKFLHQSRLSQQAGKWQYRLSRKLAGQRALVVGVGSIGHATAALLQAVGVEVCGIGRQPRDNDPVFGQIFGMNDARRLAADVHWVIGVLPATAETRDVFNTSFFAAMNPDARFINIGRGSAQDEVALAAALEKGVIAGAMLDVFREEPLPASSPLWQLDNLVISPHMSGDYQGYEEDLVRLFISNLEKFCAGKPLDNLIDKRLGYASPGYR